MKIQFKGTPGAIFIKSGKLHIDLIILFCNTQKPELHNTSPAREKHLSGKRNRSSAEAQTSLGTIQCGSRWNLAQASSNWGLQSTISSWASVRFVGSFSICSM